MQPGLEPMIYHTRHKHTNPILVFLPQPGFEPMIYHTNPILVFLTQPGLEPMIYHTREKHTNPIL
jgi:hypothetical protein